MPKKSKILIALESEEAHIMAARDQLDAQLRVLSEVRARLEIVSRPRKPKAAATPATN